MTTQAATPARVYVLERGQGPPVLFLHGNPDSSELWRDVIELLEDRFRCLAPDLPAFGRSPEDHSFDGSLEAMSEWVAAVLGRSQVTGPVHLAAHDFGAIFGMAWAIRHPHRVLRIAAGGFPFFPDYRWHFWGRVWRTRILGELSMLITNRWLFRRELRAGGPKLTDEHIESAYRLVSPATRRTILRLYRATDPQNFAAWQDGLQALGSRIPLLILWGDKDPFVAATEAERFPAARVVRFPDCGHWFPAEEPVAVARLLADFFSGGDAGSEAPSR